jgi:Phosphotransferase enzyme family
MATHQLIRTGELLTKRYASWQRGEHRREWAILRQAHWFQPDLVPRPVREELDADPPSLTMTVLAGEPLPARPDPRQLDALATAIRTLWSVPVGDLGPRPWAHPVDAASLLVQGRRPDAVVPARAYDAAARWLDGPSAAALRRPPAPAVLGHGDSNLANYLWDGRQVRVVDLEDAGAADPTVELAGLVEHMSARALDPAEICRRFDADPERVWAARCAWAMHWLHLLLTREYARRMNPVGAVDAQAARLLTLVAADRA